MKRDTKSSLGKIIVTGVVVFLAAVVGVYVGTASRGIFSKEQPKTVQPFTALKMAEGEAFPNVTVYAPDGAPVNSAEAVGRDGAVVLFMEMGCPPCEDAVQRWQKRIENGDLTHDQIMGITFDPAENLDNYRTKYGLTFPVYADSAMTYMAEYGVDAFPLTLVVGGSGRISRVVFNSLTPLDTDDLHRSLAN